MRTDVDKALGALRMAIRVEQNGYRFYQRAAREAQDPDAKELFGGLAEDEIAHERILRARLERLEQDGVWLPVGEEEWPDDGLAEVSPPIFSPEGVSKVVHDYTSELSALRMAFLIEKNAVAFYTKAARETDDPVGAAMYQDLADWEREHQGMLEQEYRFLADRFKLDMGFAPF
ncbi:MAG: ferritin-like domain-containing protein [Chloroflexota bacterium]